MWLEIKTKITQFINGYDIIMSKEIKLDDLDKYTIPEFVILLKLRKRKKGPWVRVVLLNRETIANTFQVLDTENDKVCTIWIKMKGQANCPIILGFFYSLPEGSPRADPNIVDV